MVLDFRHVAFGGIVVEQLGGLEPPFAGAEFAHIDDVAGMQGEAVEHGGDFGVRIFALDDHVDLAHGVAGAFLEVVDQVEGGVFFEEAGVGRDFGEDVAHAAVLVLQRHHVGGHLGLVEIFAVFELQIGEQLPAAVFLVSFDGDIADSVARPFVDDEIHDQPIGRLELVEFLRHETENRIEIAVFLGIVGTDFAADAGAEEAQAAVVGRQFLHVLIEFFAVEFALEKIKDGMGGIDLGSQPGGAGDGVAHEFDDDHLLLLALIDQIDRAAVLGLGAFEERDFGFVVTLAVIVFFQRPAGFLDGERIDGIADLDLGLFLKRFLADFHVADEHHVHQHGAFEHVENHDNPGGNALGVRFYADEHAGVVQRAGVVLKLLHGERPAGAGADEGRDFFERHGFVADDADFGDWLSLDGRGGDVVAHRGQGGISRRRLRRRSGRNWKKPRAGRRRRSP